VAGAFLRLGLHSIVAFAGLVVGTLLLLPVRAALALRGEKA
jgi:hypothetical protein